MTRTVPVKQKLLESACAPRVCTKLSSAKLHQPHTLSCSMCAECMGRPCVPSWQRATWHALNTVKHIADMEFQKGAGVNVFEVFATVVIEDSPRMLANSAIGFSCMMFSRTTDNRRAKATWYPGFLSLVRQTDRRMHRSLHDISRHKQECCEHTCQRGGRHVTDGYQRLK
jgi:hypothetical protein